MKIEMMVVNTITGNTSNDRETVLRYLLERFRGEHKWAIFLLFTGKKDKDGKHLYDGDIIESPAGTRYEIYYNDACAAFMRRPLDFINNKKTTNYEGGLYHTTHGWTKLGNVHQGYLKNE